jgi:beta-mannanase
MNRWFSAVTALLLAGATCLASAGPSAEADSRHIGPLVLPAKGVYTGAYIDFGDTEDDVSLEKILAFETLVGQHQAFVASSSYWGEQSFPRQTLDLIARHNSVPLVYWSPWDKPYNQDKGPDRFSLKAILAGKWDAYIDQWADSARDYGKPMLVSWGLEMNGTWFPWSGYFLGADKEVKGPDGGYAGPLLYQKAYRYVVDRVRKRGAHNIQWVFQINNYSYPQDDWNEIANYYPGDAYVDWLAMSAYGKQFTKESWVSFKNIMAWPYGELCKLNPTKPVLLAEWGVGEFPPVSQKQSFVRDALQSIVHDYPRVKAAVFWHERWENDDHTFSNLRADSSAESLEAYRNGLKDPLWISLPRWMPASKP